MPHSTSSDRVCNPRAMMTCHARHRFTVLAFQRQLWDAMPDIVHLCVQSKGYDDKPHLTSFNHVCCPRVMMACHARCRRTVFPVQGLPWYATPNFIRPCVLCKGDDSMPCPLLSDHVYWSRAMMECHARHLSFVCAVQEG